MAVSCLNGGRGLSCLLRCECGHRNLGDHLTSGIDCGELVWQLSGRFSASWSFYGRRLPVEFFVN